MMRGNHVDPAEAVEMFKLLGAGDALAIHWGTFPLSWEGVDQAPKDLRMALDSAHIDPARFRAVEVGQGWDVPPLAQPNSLSAATSSSLKSSPKTSASVER